jgi:hypothetical protein
MRKEVKWKNGDVLSFFENLDHIQVRSLILAAAIRKTLDALRPYYEFLRHESFIPKEQRFIEYETELSKVNIKFSKGATKIVGNREVYDLDLNNPEYKEAVKEVGERFPEELKHREKQIEEWKALLSEDFPEEVTLFKVDPSKIPDSAINPEDVKILAFLLE